MTVIYKCPGCGSEVVVTEAVDYLLGPDIGCNNVEDHDEREPLVMWEKNESQEKMMSDNTTRVGRCVKNKVDEYIGRGDDGDANLLNTSVGESGWLGNPYTVEEYGRETAIEKYRRVFEERLAEDEEFREAVASLSGQTLGCWCRQLDEDEPACHGDVIAEHADRLASQDTSEEDNDD